MYCVQSRVHGVTHCVMHHVMHYVMYYAMHHVMHHVIHHGMHHAMHHGMHSVMHHAMQVASYVLSLFEPCAQLYQQALSTGPAERAGNKEVRRTLAQCEGELAWLGYIIATVLGSHLTPNSNSETQQLVDGDLTCVHRTIVSTIEP